MAASRVKPAAMATVVLPNQPAYPSVPAVAASAPAAKAQPPSSAAARRSDAGAQADRQLSLLQTQRLPAKPSPQPSAKPLAPAPSRTVSATAKTQDLGLRPSNPLPPVVNYLAKPASAPDRTVRVPVKPYPAYASPHDARNSQSVPAADTQPQSGTLAGVATARNGFGNEAQVTSGPRLLVPGGGPQFGLAGQRFVIGREPGPADVIDLDLASLRGRGSERVSRRHAEIIRHGMDYFIRDLGSLNGTYIAGRGRLGRDQLYKLKDRDEIILGGAKLEFRRN
jgi:hypothetical protein